MERCRIAKALLLGGLGLAQAVVLHAAPPPPPVMVATLTPEQREELREQIRRQWQNRSPEERDRLKEEFRARREAMTPEQRQQFREQARERWQQYGPDGRERRDAWGQPGGDRPPPPGPQRF